MAARLTLHALDDGGMERAVVHDGARLARNHEFNGIELRGVLVPKDFATERIFSAVSSLTLRLWLSALETVAGEKPGHPADLTNTDLVHRAPRT